MDQSIIATVIAILAVIGGIVIYSFGYKHARHAATEELDFARRTSTSIVIRRPGHPIQRVYLLTQAQLDQLNAQRS